MLKQMNFSQLIAIVFVLGLTGCATKQDVLDLQSNIIELRQLTEEANNDANKALQQNVAMQGEINTINDASTAASKDASNNRKILEQLSDRLNKAFSQLQLK